MNRFAKTLVLALLLHPDNECMASPSNAVSIRRPLALSIVSPAAAPGFREFCMELGEFLKEGHGLFGAGIFHAVSCDNREPTTPWVLAFDVKPTETVATITYSFNGKKAQEARISLPRWQDMKTTEKGFNAALAAEILDALPASRIVTLSPNQKAIVVRRQKSEEQMSLAPVEKLHVFTLAFMPNLGRWLPRYVGEAKLKKDQDEERWTWDLTLVEQPSSGVVYFGQNAEGRGLRAKKIRRAREGVFSAVAMLAETFAGGYAGVRYGVPLTYNDPLISKSAMVGVLTEVRGGPLQGLRWYWDFAPKVQETVDGETAEYMWSRASLGWAFALPLFNKFFTHIDVVPKLGLTDFDTVVFLPNAFEPGQNVPVQFRLKNVLNLGLEVGVEKAAPWFLVRLWGASDLSGLGDIQGSGTVRSLRGGVDTYWDIADFGAVRASLLIFAIAERLTLTAKKSFSHPQSSQAVEAYSYNLAFAGLGMTLAW